MNMDKDENVIICERTVKVSPFCPISVYIVKAFISEPDERRKCKSGIYCSSGGDCR